jgi:peptidoglycan-associated lipoprotein
MMKRALPVLLLALSLAACSSGDPARGGAEVVPGGGRAGLEAGNDPGGVRGGALSATEAQQAWEREVAGGPEGTGDRVFFALDRTDLSPEAQETLRRQAEWLRRYANLTVTLEGHADERGTREYNLALGERRATAARNYLVAAGVAPERISTITYGKERPDAVGSNDAAYARNRRAVTTIN